MMKRTRTWVWAASLLGAAAALLAACGGDGGGHSGGTTTPQSTVTSAVPPEAATSPAVATTYVAELAAVPESTTNALEPVAVPDMLAADDSGEPSNVN